MGEFDYVVVGAGTAGCVLAYRLSADPAVRVLLVEAGGWDGSLFVRMPKGFSKLMDDRDATWRYPAVTGPGREEVWPRGRLVGGSSSINGMIYARGGPADWDALAGRGNPGWGWDTMAAVFDRVEHRAAAGAGSAPPDGRLRLSTVVDADDLGEEMIAAGVAQGLRRVDDLDDGGDDERIGYTTATIAEGRRVSAADAFLHPVRDRPNLTVTVRATVQRVLVAGGRAVGVRVRQGGRSVDHAARAEVVLAAGAIASPQLLQVSGIGPADVLRAVGVPVVADRPRVGAGMREHRMMTLQYRLAGEVGYNPLLNNVLGQSLATLRWLVGRRGPLALPVHDIAGYLRSSPQADRPDAHLLMAPFSAAPRRPGRALELERRAGLMCLGAVSRPRSEGSLQITGPTPQTPPRIRVDYLTDPYDRRVAVATFRRMRELFATGPIARRIVAETVPGPAARDEREIIDAALAHGYCGYHAVGTCAMGPDDADVVDPRLRVRGVDGLRVVDASVFPTLVSGWINGPVAALAWRAADLMLR
ncbi:GMC family oxidoreductase N-terminal domain-containing protein [Micromonospora sp. WMMD882]|uniref:GMC family oxidoreductase n=1 Tax=Micromonospora sp. WMMD882 TaxID=3015151 RepID=UPI00248D0323|nr:GMC family oxidoreductase N-terminal domain-containing protein [Micromonospora sp. WMMD882]WBB80077.1 GMC family oxidoreductase N-terminal domain-containing protein [Micromonospora sp. WMMD882]